MMVLGWDAVMLVGSGLIDDGGGGGDVMTVSVLAVLGFVFLIV